MGFCCRARSCRTRCCQRREYVCYYCSCVIVGRRYAYPRNRAYHACVRCVPESWYDTSCSSSCSSTKSSTSNPPVPDAPLEEHDFNTDVQALQKILANLGYLAEHCLTLSGYYCARTAAAVRDFRCAYRVPGCDTCRYDRRTRDMLQRVVCDC